MRTPRDGVMMVMEGSTYGRMVNDEFVRKYPHPTDIPSNLYPRYVMLSERNDALIEAAEAMGWKPTGQ